MDRVSVTRRVTIHFKLHNIADNTEWISREEMTVEETKVSWHHQHFNEA